MKNKIKVALIFREDRKGGFSIEEIFNCIEEELKPRIEFIRFKINKAKSLAWNIYKIRKIDADIFHITGDCNYVAVFLNSNKTILTVHDIGHYQHTLRGLKRLIYGIFWWRFPLMRVKYITAVSNFTANNLNLFFNVNLNKIHVIPNPIFEGFYSRHDNVFNEIPNILQIGSGHNKNRNGLIEAIKNFKCKLVIVGELDEATFEKLEIYNIQYENFVGITLSKLQNIYSTSDILFFASFYEGFGLPIIEAFASGVPVITSNIASMPETANGAAILVNPFEVTEIAQAIKDLTENQNLRKTLIMKGKIISRIYQRITIANMYFKLYCEIVKFSYDK